MLYLDFMYGEKIPIEMSETEKLKKSIEQDIFIDLLLIIISILHFFYTSFSHKMTLQNSLMGNVSIFQQPGTFLEQVLYHCG